tara:strand:- start:674 stop:838 length:165 start_codon:yes stop_codon:yes gene_type:complete
MINIISAGVWLLLSIVAVVVGILVSWKFMPVMCAITFACGYFGMNCWYKWEDES